MTETPETPQTPQTPPADHTAELPRVEEKPATPAAPPPAAGYSEGASAASGTSTDTRSPLLKGGALAWNAASTAIKAIVLIVALLALLFIYLFATRGFDIFPDWANPFKTETTVTSTTPLQLKLEDLHQYHAAVGTYEVVLVRNVDAKYLPGFISGEKTIMVAKGSVDGYVDFSNLGPDRVKIDQETKTATINLPAVQLGQPVVDVNATQVIDRDRGAVQRLGSAFGENINTDQDLMNEAQGKIAAAANANEELRQRTEANTRTMLQQLATSVGFTTVTVNFEQPVRP